MFRHVRSAAATAAVAAVVLAGLLGAPVAANADSPAQAIVQIEPSRVGLANGQFMGEQKGASGAPLVTVADTTPSRSFDLTVDANGEAKRVVNYQIVMQGQPTGYWMKATVRYGSGSWWYTCDLVKGNPAGNYQLVKNTGFTCHPYSWPYPDGNRTAVNFKIELNRWAEASGVLQTKGEVGLAAGRYDFNNLVYRKAGTAEVSPNSSTDFNVVAREGDPGFVADLARARFHYRILDNGVPTEFWVVGWSQTERRASFQHQAQCFVTHKDPGEKPKPGETAVPLDEIPRDQIAPYECRTLSEDTITGNGSYHAVFEIGKRTMQVIDANDSVAAADLIKRYCRVESPDCNISLAQAEKGWKTLDSHTISVENRTSTVFSKTITKTATHTSSTSISLEVTASWSGDVLGQKFALAVKNGYTWQTTDTTTYTETYTLSPPGWMRYYIELRVPVVTARGDVMIHARDTGKFYVIKDAQVELADSTRPWAEEPREEKLVNPNESPEPAPTRQDDSPTQPPPAPDEPAPESPEAPEAP
ncbi:hypothetical protein [Microbacterium sp.]|uniref:hypothetical protein n=1 Tax=Microbacterium sp. TaxID=51671 RepID=UPI002734354A|nr:hypothetical protein [Microbacterium sp.]MDP3952090.1 hypothetical protein [Microbacterium sp.]